MTPKTIVIVSYLSGIIPFIAGILVFKKAHKKFYPFLFFIFLTGFVALIYTSILLFSKYQHTVSFINFIETCYAFAEITLITLFFKNLGLFEKQEALFKPLLILFILLGVFDYVYSIERPMLYFGAFIRVVGTIFSIVMINRISRSRNKNLLVSVEFVIYCGFVTYYFIDLTASIFLFNFVPISKFFRARLYIISSVCTLLSEVIFMYALILMRQQAKLKPSELKVPVSFLTQLESTNQPTTLKEKQTA